MGVFCPVGPNRSRRFSNLRRRENARYATLDARPHRSFATPSVQMHVYPSTPIQASEDLDPSAQQQTLSNAERSQERRSRVSVRQTPTAFSGFMLKKRHSPCCNEAEHQACNSAPQRESGLEQLRICEAYRFGWSAVVGGDGFEPPTLSV